MATIGFIGLGRMGKSMVLNLLDHKKKVVANNRSPGPIKEVARRGAVPAYTVEELISKLPSPKIVWIMIPAGKITETMINKVSKLLKKGDIIIDGGNSFYKDSIRRHAKLKKKGINFLDCGTSGGQGGARYGACMMVGGDKAVFKKVEWAFKTMCVKDGYGYMGKTGAGHFVKMVHNGIEYGMMGAIAEGIYAVEKHSNKFGTNLSEVIKVYAHGSIIESHLMTWLEDAWKKDKGLKKIACEVPKGETEEEMKKLEKLSPMQVLHTARMMRVQSRQKGFCGNAIAAMRYEFGGHAVKKAKKR